MGQTGATLNGTINDNGASTTVTFDYGTTNAYGTNIAATTGGTVSASTGSTAAAVTLTGLTCNTTYHFRVKGVNSVNTTNGNDATFTTTACAPGAPTIGSATPADASATVAFSAPASDGGAAITGYTATASPGGITAVGNGGTALPITVTGLTNGVAYTFTVTASNSVGPGAASAASNSVTPKASQTITFSNPGAQSFGTTPTLTASSSAGGGYPVSFTSATTGVCTITTGGVLTFVTTGSCTINADQAGDGSTLAAPQVSQTFNVNAVVPGAPTIGTATAGVASASVTFTQPASNGGAAITGYTVTSSPGGLTGTGASSPITVSGLTNGVAYTFTVTAANTAGPGSASAASNSVTPKASQTITFSNPGAQSFGTTPTLTASSSAGGGYPVSFTSATTGVCTITTGGVLTFVTTGSCTINANQAGDGSTLAAPQVSQTFAVNAVAPGAPTIGTATAGVASASVTFTQPASNGGAAITGYIVTSNPGGLTGTGASSPITVSGLTNGVAYTFTVTAANTAGPGSASAASNSVTPKASQTITFSNPGAQSFGTTPTLTASSSAGGGYPVSFTSATTGVCTITTGGVLTFVTTGSCTINANQAGDGSTLAAPQVSQTFTVNAAAPGVPTSVVASAGNSQATVSWTAPAGNGGAAIIGYRVQIATTSGGTYADAAGTCAFATTGTSTAVTCIATGLTNGTQYFFKVAAVSSAGTGSYSTASSGVTPIAPVINGACGTSANVATAFLPTANLCSAGTAEPVTPGSSSWAWSCTGTGPSATNATCSAPYPVVNGGGGTVGAIQTQSTNGWQIDQTASGFVALPAAAPAGVTLPGGATKVVLNTGTRGTSTTVTLRFSSIPAGAQLYKYGKENGIGDTNKWFAYPANIDVAAGTVTYTLTDGQRGDNDWTENSVIDDPVALGSSSVVASIPTLSEWGLIILSTLMALFGLVWMRRRQGFASA